jgi:hypothetical protein
MSDESSQQTNEPAKRLASQTAPEAEPADHHEQELGSDGAAVRSKLSVNVGHDISERLRSLAYTHRLSESSIVEVALTMFFARGDDAMLGVMLKELGATLRRR